MSNMPKSENSGVSKMTKTCGECNFYNREKKVCWFYDDVSNISHDDFCRKHWEPAKKETNRERINKLSNSDFAELWSKQKFIFAWCYDCPEYCKDGCEEFNNQRCATHVKKWLEQDLTEIDKIEKGCCDD